MLQKSEEYSGDFARFSPEEREGGTSPDFPCQPHRSISTLLM
jgi:hypothetical protein